MGTFYLVVVIFLLILAVMGLFIGVSNDAVNFLSSAVGTKAAPTRWIIVVAAAGIMCGASINNGMMEIARNGVFNPEYFFAGEVMCIFMAVMFANLILLDMFIMMGMPTSTTVAMVFELLGGTVAIALVKVLSHNVDCSLVSLINTDKAFGMILGIFLSVAIAFIFGTVVQYLVRLVYTFNIAGGSALKKALFGGVATMALVYFMLIKGVGNAPFLGDAQREWLSSKTSGILVASLAVSTLLMYVLSLLRVNVFKVVVMIGTFALAMAFAGNDLVNFIGVPLAGLDAYSDFSVNAASSIDTYLMTSLNSPSKIPSVYLMAAGAIMVVSLATSKKAQHVLRTSLSLSRQDTGDEMFGSSAMARTMVRTATQLMQGIDRLIPERLSRWVDSRFDNSVSDIEQDAAFDCVRGSVNLVLAGMLISLGTSMRLPLSTTFVAFMVSMGTSLSDRAWGRESAVYRVTGVFSVIGGWLFTAVAAFLLAFVMALLLYYGSYVAIVLMAGLSVLILVRDNVNAKKRSRKRMSADDGLMTELDPQRLLALLLEHSRTSVLSILDFSEKAYRRTIDGFLNEDVKMLRHTISEAVATKAEMKILKRKEISAMRRLDPMIVMKKNTWFHLSYNCCEQMLYSIRRICDPCKEHVDNSFMPLDEKYRDEVLFVSALVTESAQIAREAISSGDYSDLEPIRDRIKSNKDTIREVRRRQVARIASNADENIDVSTLYLSIIQESEELVTEMRHLIRDIGKLYE